MASNSLSEALDALEACLDALDLEMGAEGADAVAAALAQPVTAFNAGAKEALR